MPGERILIVDDSKYMVSFLADTALPALGYQPVVATTGQRGLEMVSSQRPDVILLDFNLPDMTGMDVVRHLAAAGNQTPVILMTAYGSEQVAVEAFRLGVRDYLSKPIELDEVANALERALHEPRLQRDKRQLAEELHRTNLELRNQADQVTTFTSIGRAITSSLNLDQILTRVIQGGIQLCQAEEATIWLLDDRTKELVMVAEKGVDHDAIRLRRMKVADNLAGEAMRTRRPVRRAAGPGGGIKIKTGYLVLAVMYIPIMIQDNCLGVMCVANRRSMQAFDQLQQDSLQALADYAAIAIQNARIFKTTDDSLQKGLSELAAINEISEAVATFDLKVLLRRAMNRIHKAFDVAAATLFLADEEQTELHFTLCSNMDPGTVSSLQVPFGKGLVGNCVVEGTGLYTNDPQTHPLFLSEFDTLNGFETKSLLAVPLTLKERVIGAIELLNKRTSSFNEQDVRLLRAMAIPVAVAVENARLFEQVERERAMLQAVLDGGANPILIVDQSGYVLQCNPVAHRLFGLSAGPAYGKPLGEVTGLPRLAGLVEQGEMITEEIAVQDRTYLTSVAPIAHVGSVVEMQDITYLKELDQAKSDFVTAVSHDLRSPLTSIAGFVDLLSEAGPLNADQSRFVKQATQATDKMRQMVDDLLDLARIEAGVGSVETTCDLYEIAQDVVSEFQGLAMQRRIQLSLSKQGEIPSIQGHADRLRRAVANLVGNALKYTQPGGQVRVGMQTTGNRLFLAVLDSGMGIPQEDIPHIFEPFYRVEDHKEISGSGLGLTMVKSIVEGHGGSISVHSEVGRGSRFVITLPCA